MKNYIVSINRNERNIYRVKANSSEEAEKIATDHWSEGIESIHCTHGPDEIQYGEWSVESEEEE